jgi:GT2 family glycosyltransferase
VRVRGEKLIGATPAPTVVQVLNVLTRTANRPNRFERCRQSILAQETDVTIRHLVSLDGPCTYAQGDVLIPARGKIAPRIPADQQRHRNAPYNLFVNDLLAAVEDGWIFVLDDDDEFLRRDAVAVLAPYLVDENALVVFKFAMGDNKGRQFIMPKAHGRGLIMNDVPSSCYVYHSRHKDLGLWHSKYAGDFFAASNLAEELRIVWLDEVLAGTQSGPSEGRGDASQPTQWQPRTTKQKKKDPFLSIVIPVMNQCGYTKAILQNIAETVHMPHEVIVVDNGSTDDTAQVLENARARVIRNKTNPPLSKAWNQGCAKAKGTHIAVLNNDLELPDGWAEKLVAHERHAICPRYEQGPKRCANFENRNSRLRASLREADRPGTHPNGFAGFCFLITREVWERVGPFDESLIIWFGDNDYYLRTKGMGYVPYMAQNVLIHHYGNVTCNDRPDFISQRESDRKTFLKKWPRGMAKC